MKIYLRPITLQDGPLIVKWRNDPKIISHCMSKATVTIESNAEFYKKNVQTGKYKQFIVECIEETTGVVVYPIASVYLKDMDYTNKKCELCIFTSTDSEWYPKSQSKAIKILIEKAFTEYGMHKVYTHVFYRFQDEVEILKAAGFSVEAILREEAVNEDNGFEDIVRLCVIDVSK